MFDSIRITGTTRNYYPETGRTYVDVINVEVTEKGRIRVCERADNWEFPTDVFRTVPEAEAFIAKWEGVDDFALVVDLLRRALAATTA